MAIDIRKPGIVFNNDSAQSDEPPTLVVLGVPPRSGEARHGARPWECDLGSAIESVLKY